MGKSRFPFYYTEKERYIRGKEWNVWIWCSPISKGEVGFSCNDGCCHDFEMSRCIVKEFIKKIYRCILDQKVSYTILNVIKYTVMQFPTSDSDIFSLSKEWCIKFMRKQDKEHKKSNIRRSTNSTTQKKSHAEYLNNMNHTKIRGWP